MRNITPVEQALSICGINSNSRVIDIGCGSGETISYISETFGCYVCGVEPDEIFFKAAQRANPNADIFQITAEDSDLKNIMNLTNATNTAKTFKKFDIAIAECSMSLFVQPESALANIRAVLKTGGKFIMSDVYSVGLPLDAGLLPKTGLPSDAGSPSKTGLPSEAGLPGVPWLRNVYTLQIICGMLNQAGFTVKMREDCGGYLKQMLGQMILNYGATNHINLDTELGYAMFLCEA